MPEADDVEFWVIKNKSCFAKWQWTGERHRISISSTSVSHSMTLLMYLGHEMCHLAEDILGLNPGGKANVHGAKFRKLAARFCRIHGCDVKAFF